MSERHLFTGMSILLDNKLVHDQAVIVEDAKIKAIVPESMIQHHLPAVKHSYPRDHYLLPGFIDGHVHGACGYDVMDGTGEALAAISVALAQEGVTGFLATTMSAPTPELDRVLINLRDHGPSLPGAAMLGIHLEGPFIANIKKGAQLGGCEPDVDRMKHWINLSNELIKIVTLAPELPGALSLINLLNEKQIIPAMGHTDATYAEAEAAIHAGCRQVTHCFNAMRTIHQREPGVVIAALLSGIVALELIVDGVHVHPAMLMLALRLKRKDHILLVTDAMRAKAMSDGTYELGGQTVRVTKGRATLPDGTLAGSTLRMPRAIKRMAKEAEISLAAAIEMATINPARVLGLSTTKGSISMGKDADLVVLNHHFDVIKTLVGGRIVYDKTESSSQT